MPASLCSDTSSELTSSPGIWCGSRDPTQPADGRISRSFYHVLSNLLKPGYVGCTDKVKCPNNNCNPRKNLGMQSATRLRHETFNSSLKNWGILERVHRHDIAMHGTVFYACTVITQLSVANGEPLFKVEYGNE